MKFNNSMSYSTEYFSISIVENLTLNIENAPRFQWFLQKQKVNSSLSKKVLYKSILKFFILDILKMSIFDFLGGLFLLFFQKVG